METINYTRIAMAEIHPEARKIAVAWIKGFEKWMKPDVRHKVKLASDIMNFAIAYHQDQTAQLQQAGVVRGCQCETRIGETTVWCCNQCGLPCEDGWLPTNYAFGSRTVADCAVGKGVSDGWYCKVFNEDGMMTDDEKCKSQCEKCAQH